MRTHDLWDIRFTNQIIDTMADGLFTLDDKGRITSWNRAMERISGYKAEEAVGKGCELLQCSLCFGKSCPADITKCGVTKDGVSDDKECFIRHCDGYDIPVIKSARRIKDSQDRVLGIVQTIKDLTELNRMKKKAEEAERRLGERYRLGIIGKSSVMQHVFEAVNAVSKSLVTVLITGESGTGKELVAGAIHYNSMKAGAPMVTVNCSALPETLLESELFGHVKGAFTGATRDRIGRFEEADTGTVFLDEIGELTPYMQIKLLRVLQEREIERVGDSKRISINIRVIAATNQDLYELTRQGKFREDLFYRLKVFPIHIRPLRERREDIPLLVRHFIDKINKTEGKHIEHVSPDGMEHLMKYPWPGNVRELENAIEHAFVVCRGNQIHSRDLPAEIRGLNEYPEGVVPGSCTKAFAHKSDLREKLTRESLLTLLDDCGWNKAEVARCIGKSRTSVWKYMKKWNIPLQKE